MPTEGPIMFGEWLPDQPALNSPGLLEANNVLPDVGYYRPYNPLATVSPGIYTLPATARGLHLAADILGRTFFYAGSDTLLYSNTLSGQFQTRSGVLGGGNFDWRFQQFENLMFACNGAQTMVHTVGATSNFVVAAAPTAETIGLIGQFLMVGAINDGTTRPFTVRWSAIGDPNNFPTPNSATAIATQAGEQDLNVNFGPVRAIVNGDQHGMIFQENGITRVTYVGPPVVFQFDEIERKLGAPASESVVKNGEKAYFWHPTGGFNVTDGVTTASIGVGKIDKTFLAMSGADSFNGVVRAVVDAKKNCVMWANPELTSSIPSRLVALNMDTNGWSRANQALRCIDKSDVGSVQGPFAFDLNNVVCTWKVSTTGPTNVGTATITTGDFELNPGGRAFVSGIKPNVETAGTPPTVTVRLGSRNDLTTATSFTVTTGPTTRTGFADFRVDSKYQRAEVQIVGNFDKATGIEFKAIPTGEA